MKPMKLTFSERASLRWLVRLDGTCYQRQLKAAHAKRFLDAGLIAQTPQRYHLTIRGQVELLRQRYFGLRSRAEAAVQKDEDAFLFIQSNAF